MSGLTLDRHLTLPMTKIVRLKGLILSIKALRHFAATTQ